MKSLYYRFVYQRLMRLVHRFDWHYAPIIGPMEDGTRLRWCHWCGMRDRVIDVSKGPLGKNAVQEK